MIYDKNRVNSNRRSRCGFCGKKRNHKFLIKLMYSKTWICRDHLIGFDYNKIIIEDKVKCCICGKMNYKKFMFRSDFTYYVRGWICLDHLNKFLLDKMFGFDIIRLIKGRN